MSIVIKEIKNVRNLNLKRSEYDSKIGLVYGLNGSGKTTIKKVLHSLTNGSSLEKNFGSLGSNSEVELLVNGKQHTYKNGWDKALAEDSLLIFDNNFVNDNIYIDGKVSQSTKEQFTRVIYGKNLVKKYKDLTKINEKLFKAKDEYYEILNEMKQSDTYLDLYNASNSLKVFENILNNDKNLSVAGSKVVEQHIKENLIDTLSSRKWLKEGIRHKKNDTLCPMCGQNLFVNEIILFNEIEDNELIERTYSSFESSLKSEKENLKLFRENTTLNVGRKDYIISKLEEIVDSKLESWSQKMSVKNNPTLNHFNSSVLTTYNHINKLPSKIINQVIDDIVQQCLVLVSKKFPRAKELLDVVNKINTLSKKSDENKKEIKSKIEAEFRLKIENINDDLKRYGFPYELRFDGIHKSAKISSKKSGTSVATDLLLYHVNSDVEVKQKSLGDTLSQGEKTVLAWVLFKNMVQYEMKDGNKIMLLDDPISSYDDFKRFPMLRDIRFLNELGKDNNTVILTHEKSLVSLYSRQSYGKLYLLKNNELTAEELDSILKNEILDKVTRLIQINSEGIKNNNIIEFIVKSRKLIEFNNLLVNNTSVLTGDYKNAFNNLSKVLHNEGIRIYEKTIKFLFRIINSLVSRRLKPNFVLDITKVNCLDIAIGNKNSIYSHRIIIEEYLKHNIPKGKLNSIIDRAKKRNKDLTIGMIFECAKKHSAIKETYLRNISYALPIVNTVYHHGGVYGLNERDISEVNLKDVQKTVDVLVTETW
ncbi:hypothetical protein RJG79_02845 [Mycoplasmatota bacterium WC44]